MKLNESSRIERKTKQPKKAAVRPAILFAIAAIVWTVVMMASLHWRFLDRFVAGTWHSEMGLDFFQLTRGYNNLLIGNNIFCTDLGEYGPYATPCLCHPFVAVAVGPWTAPLAPWTGFWLFVAVSLGLLLLSAWLLASVSKTSAYRGFVYFAIFCSLPTYLMLWDTQSHVLLVLAVSLILSGLMRMEQEPLSEKRYCRWIQIGLVISMLSKPLVVLMLPVLFVAPETRRKLLLPVTIYTVVSLLFLVVGGLNPGGYNGSHWLNIVNATSSAKQVFNCVIPVETDLLSDHGLYSLPIFLGRILGGSVPSIFLKLPFVALFVMSLTPLVLEGREQRLRAAIVTVSLCIFSHFLDCYQVHEYYYTMLLPVLPALLWLWQRESVPWLRRLLMASFVVSLLIFAPTPYFLAPKQPARFQTMNLLQRVMPVLVAFLFLTVYGAASTWLRRRTPKLITTQMIQQFWPTLWLGTVLGTFLGSVLAAAYATAPCRLRRLPSNWTNRDFAEHYDEAIAEAQRALEAWPGYAEAHYNLGNALAGRGQVDAAIAHYQKVLEIKPNNAETLNNLGYALARRGEFDKAIAHFQKSLEIKPDSAEIHYNLGNALAGRGRVDSAIAHYQKALEIKPDFAEAHANLANVLLGQGQWDEALRHLRKVVELSPEGAGPRNTLGAVLATVGRFDEALSQFREAVQIQPNNAEARKNLAWLRATCPQASLRNGAEAIEQARRADQLCGSRRPDVLDVLAAAYAEAGRFPEAVVTAQKALHLATQQHNQGLADALRARLTGYEDKTPYRQTRSDSMPRPPRP